MTDAQQSEYINQSDWIAYNNKRVKTVAQYKIVDDVNIAAGFQMGLRLFNGGARKPAYDAYKLPLWVVDKGANLTVYGQVRPADAGAAGTVDVQNAPAGSSAFKTVATVPVTQRERHLHRRGPGHGRCVATFLERDHLAPGGGSEQVKRFVVAAAAAISLVGAAPAAAQSTFEVGMEDEGIFLANQHLAPGAAAAWKQWGVDVVRIHARWGDIAPGQEAQSKPAGFDAGNHADPQYNWAVMDNAIAIIRGAGLKVMLTLTGPGPLWSSTRAGQAQPQLEA